MSDGGKGSTRRNEDTQKVLEGYNRIFGESKLDRRLREEQEAMQDLEDESFEDDEIEDCDWCNGTGEGRYEGHSCSKCNGKGVIFYTDESDYD